MSSLMPLFYFIYQAHADFSIRATIVGYTRTSLLSHYYLNVIDSLTIVKRKNVVIGSVCY